MPEDVPAETPERLHVEMEASRESAARLLDNLSRKMGASRTVRSARAGVNRAVEYVRGGRFKELAADIELEIRRRPAVSMATAVAAGLLIGWLLNRRRSPD